jgi:hypothetical protein
LTEILHFFAGMRFALHPFSSFLHKTSLAA